jgi:hypothetical protein
MCAVHGRIIEIAASIERTFFVCFKISILSGDDFIFVVGVDLMIS